MTDQVKTTISTGFHNQGHYLVFTGVYVLQDDNRIKIKVAGGGQDYARVEVFDPNSRDWHFLTSLPDENRTRKFFDRRRVHKEDHLWYKDVEKLIKIAKMILGVEE